MQKIIILIKKYWIFFILGIFAIIFILFQSSAKQPQETSTPLPTPITSSLTYKNIQPGITLESQLNQNLGTPINTTKKNTTSISEFTSDYPTDPHIAVNKNNTTVLFIENPPLKPPQNISKIINQFGPVTTTRFLDHLGPSYNLSLYLDQGLGFGVHTNTGDIVEIWYFQPGSLTNLELISPYDLLTSPPKYDSP
ncbi:hypothetical protein KJ953_00045 [Patescibacteria group bacterium]|nr:hypothetical protein [Patescibacteria group bacterium]MBU1256766.1 hypothetical protein [Patescibacteria group bacterium]MBU1457841.1 hypothetical protein [Patescibacteria group bacterium]